MTAANQLPKTPTPGPRKRSHRKPANIEKERTVEVAEHTISKMAGKDNSPEIKVETPPPNKYDPKPKVGTPTLGRSPNYVTKVGLGNLKTITAHGNTNV